MINRSVLLVTATLCTLPLAGCGKPAGVFPVTGRVLYKGEPASGAVVYFQQQGTPGVPQELVPFGIVQNDGAFSLTCDGLGEGALPGSYKVLIEWRDGKQGGVVPVKGKGQSNLVKRTRIHAGPDRLKGRYFDANKPLLQAEVKPGPNKLEPFDLKD